jgi:hypothetical protein
MTSSQVREEAAAAWSTSLSCGSLRMIAISGTTPDHLRPAAPVPDRRLPDEIAADRAA